MVKRGRKKTSKKVSLKSDKSIKLLIENTVTLQKVLTTLSMNLKGLTGEISHLLTLFKEASKTIGEEKAVEDVVKEERKDLVSKLDALIDQNRTIAKGLILLESTIKEKNRPREFNF